MFRLPPLPTRITGFSSNAADFGEATVYFTAAGSDSDDSQYRIRASVLDGGPDAGGQLLVGVPLDSTVSILDRLVGVELAVTGAALVAALLFGLVVGADQLPTAARHRGNGGRHLAR